MQGPQFALLKKGCPFKRAFAHFCPLFAPFFNCEPSFFCEKVENNESLSKRLNFNVLNNKRELQWIVKRLRNNIPHSFLTFWRCCSLCNLVMIANIWCCTPFLICKKLSKTTSFLQNLKSEGCSFVKKWLLQCFVWKMVIFAPKNKICPFCALFLPFFEQISALLLPF